MRLLIADADPTLTELYEAFFENEGFDVETASDGLQCMLAARRSMPDVLVLEYELPWGGGDGVLASLRQEFPTMPIDVMLITGDLSQDDVSHELHPPVCGCLRKPFRLRQLSNLIRATMKDA